MSAHTPGPWAIGGMHGHQYVRITADNNNVVVGLVRDCEQDGLDKHGMHRWVQTDEGRANSRLVAAAPELLAACTEALALLRTVPDEHAMPDHSVFGALRAAIAKAEGRA